MGKVTAICISDKRGVCKRSIDSGFFEAGHGIKGDAHAGEWHRQISLLSANKIDEFNMRGANVTPGAFGENLSVEGFDFRALPVGTLLRCGEALFEITQIGKECHTHCEIFKKMGDCIMPREGVFARVLSSGMVTVGDEMVIETSNKKTAMRAAIITLSDKGSRGERENKSGKAIYERLTENGYEIIQELLLPDDSDALKNALIDLCDRRRPDLILTTGGTGFSHRDTTPEATLAIAERNAPGIAEAIRAASLLITPNAMLSRAVSVIRGSTLIINLPGSPKACIESMDVFLSVIPHAIGLLREEVSDCANP